MLPVIPTAAISSLAMPVSASTLRIASAVISHVSLMLTSAHAG